MKRVYILAALTATLAALVACDRSGKDVSQNMIRFQTMEDSPSDAATRAGDTNRALQPMFLFWTNGHFNDASADGSVDSPDFFVQTSDYEIDHWNSTLYNTQKYYPIQDKEIYAAGFAPAPGDGYLSFATEGDYSKFVIPANTSGTTTCPDDPYGVMDILSAPRMTGKDSSPLTAAGPMKFYHAQTKLFFDAKLATTMRKYVKQVKIQLPDALVPRTLEWSETEARYVVKGVEGDEYITLFNYWTDDGTTVADNKRANETMFFGVSSANFEHLGYTYTVPPGSTLSFIVSFKLSDTDVNPVWKDVTIPIDVDFSTPLKAGDAYRIKLVIDVLDIELSATKVDWVDGGYVSINVPITVS